MLFLHGNRHPLLDNRLDQRNYGLTEGMGVGAAMRGLYRYETAQDRWWVCVEEDGGGRVNMMRDRYEQKELEPPFLELPLESSGRKRKRG